MTVTRGQPGEHLALRLPRQPSRPPHFSGLAPRGSLPGPPERVFTNRPMALPPNLGKSTEARGFNRGVCDSPPCPASPANDARFPKYVCDSCRAPIRAGPLVQRGRQACRHRPPHPGRNRGISSRSRRGARKASTGRVKADYAVGGPFNCRSPSPAVAGTMTREQAISLRMTRVLFVHARCIAGDEPKSGRGDTNAFDRGLLHVGQPPNA